jgi:hypothetical protein
MGAEYFFLSEPYKIPPGISVTGIDLCVRLSVCSHSAKWLVRPSSTSPARLQACLFHLDIQGAAMEFTVQRQMHRTRDARVFGCHFFVRRVAMHRVTSDCRVCWRAASSDAFALYLIVAGCGRVPKTFSKARALACMQSPCAHHVSPRAERIVHNVSQACDAQPDRTNVFLTRSIGRQKAAAYATLARLSTRIT